MRSTVFALIAYTATVWAASAAPSASFDCGKAATPVEKLICSDDGMAGLDVQIAHVFGRLVAAHPENAAVIRDSQRFWLNERTQCTSGQKRAESLSCLAKQYRARMALLQSGAFVACGKVHTTGKSFSLSCAAPSNPLRLSFVVSGNKGDAGEAELAKLSIRAGGKPQDFKLDGQIFFDGLDSALELMDLNFDGYEDIKLTTSTSAGPNMWYDYWAYVPKTGRFAATKLGEQLSGFDVTPDPKTKTIRVIGRSSCCSWEASVYRWVGPHLRLQSREMQEQFTSVNIPGIEDVSLCGREIDHFNGAGELTRIDLELGAFEDFECDSDVSAEQGKLLDKLKRGREGFRLVVKDAHHFQIVLDKPIKPAY